MTAIWVAAGLGLAAMLFVGMVLSRQSSRQKKQAIASLEAERAAVTTPSILELVNEEVEDLGLRDVPGAEGIPPDVLLRAWRDAPEELRHAERDLLAFAVDPDADPASLQAGDLELVPASDLPPTEPPSDDTDDDG